MTPDSLDMFNTLLVLLFIWLCGWGFLDWCRKHELTRSERFWLIVVIYLFGPLGWMIWAWLRKRKRHKPKHTGNNQERPRTEDSNSSNQKRAQAAKPKRKEGLTQAEILGIEGEEEIAAALKELPHKQVIMRNVYLPHPDDYGAYTEIDVLYIDERGIVIIESKNYEGEVYPNLKGKDWTHCIHGQTYSFYNPLWQNNLHARALKQVLPREFHDSLYSIVVFGNRADIKELLPGQRLRSGIFYTRDLASHLMLYYKDEPVIIDARRRVELLRMLAPYRNASEEQKAAHIQYVQNKRAQP